MAAPSLEAVAESHVDLASSAVGGEALFATDEWFAAADNLCNPAEPIFNDDFTPYGKWMDGWESRRRRSAGHDWAIIKLGLPGRIVAIDVDTCFFTGNFSPQVAIQAARLPADDAPLAALAAHRAALVRSRPDGAMGTAASPEGLAAADALGSRGWATVVPMARLGAGYPDTRHNLFLVHSDQVFTHLRVNQHPDGGIARLRVYGVVAVEPSSLAAMGVVDLAGVAQGGRALCCSNAHYGHPRNMLNPGRGRNMGEGWETARQSHRPPVFEEDEATGLIKLPGSDHAVIRLGVPGHVVEVEVDTQHFRGNYPESCRIDAAYSPDSDDVDAMAWRELLPRTRLGPDQSHLFSLPQRQLADCGTITHAKLTIFPDGGVMRLRLRGQAAPGGSRL